MKKMNVTTMIEKAIFQATENGFTSDEIKMLELLCIRYSNRKKEDKSGLAYAIADMTGDTYLCLADCSREYLTEKFFRLIVEPKNFYRVAAFRPSQIEARENNLTINFPYPVSNFINHF